MDVRWLKKPERANYDAACDYLSLLMRRSQAKELVGLLRDDPASAAYKPKDIIRASQLPVLEHTNRHVFMNLDKIKQRHGLSPLLLIRPLTSGSPLIIADGYYRACAVYYAGTDTPIPCRIINAPRKMFNH